VKPKAAEKDNLRVVSENRRARHDYAIEDQLEAGLVLLGSEVKSLRAGTANLSDSYALPKGDELFLLNARISPYNAASFFGHEPTRARKLLLHRAELDRWVARVRERGYSIIPLMLYFKGGKAKVRLGLARGKTHEDRRQDLKEKESKREVERALRRR
jgi:SsrA-binding protein